MSRQPNRRRRHRVPQIAAIVLTLAVFATSCSSDLSIDTTAHGTDVSNGDFELRHAAEWIEDTNEYVDPERIVYSRLISSDRSEGYVQVLTSPFNDTAGTAGRVVAAVAYPSVAAADYGFREISEIELDMNYRGQETARQSFQGPLLDDLDGRRYQLDVIAVIGSNDMVLAVVQPVDTYDPSLTEALQQAFRVS